MLKKKNNMATHGMLEANPNRPLIKGITIMAFAIVYTVGVGMFLSLKLLGTDEIAMIKESARFSIVPLSMGIGLLASLAIGLLEVKLFSKWTHYSLPKFVLCKYALIIATIVLGEIAGALLYQYMTLPAIDAVQEIPRFIVSETFISIFIYLLVFSIALNVFGSIAAYLSPAALLDALVGRYKQPQEENLTFIFIDLKSSTTLAESLGHKQYSRFIDHCFLLLTDCIYRHRATLYQFVGDEAILLWEDKKARKTSAPAELYFDFCRSIEAEREMFLKSFGEVPRFRAAIHEGLVTATVIKSVAKSVVYHGDVLNTCARIMSLCSSYDVDLLVSEKVADWLRHDKRYVVAMADNVTLRGKTQQTEIYKVEENQ